MSTIYKCDRCGREMNKICNRLKEVVVDGTFRLEGTKYFEPETVDLCEECYKDFKSFMFGPERDLDSKTTLRPWSEVGEPPKINGCGQCEFDSTSIDEEPCASCDSGNSNFKPKNKKDTDHANPVGSYVVLDSDVVTCEQCKFKDFSWDEEPCSTCKYSVIMRGGDDQSDNFESKEEEDTGNLSKAKYKLASYIRSDMNGDSGSIYKIVDIRVGKDGEIIYNVINLSTNAYSTLTESTINNWYTVIVKYSCKGCKLEGTDDITCDTCIVADPKGPRRQWWKPKEEDE